MNYHSKSRKNWGVDQHYKDLDGNTKSFTVINHDPKLSISTSLVGYTQHNHITIKESEEEILCSDILSSEISETKEFIDSVNNLLSIYGVERFNKNAYLKFSEIYLTQYKEEGYFIKLKDLWETFNKS